MIVKYVRGEAVLYIETVKRLQDIEKREAGDKKHVFAVLDAFLATSKNQAMLK
jgi:hypothetical protein